MNFKFLIIIFVITLILGCNNHNELSEELEECIKKVALNNTYGDPNIRADWSVKTPNEQYEVLLKDTPKLQIIQLTRQKNQTVRAYAFKELIERKDEELAIIFKKLINDRSRVEVRHSDVIMEDFLYSIFYYEVANANVILSKNLSDSLFYNDLLLELNEIAINSKIREKNDRNNISVLRRAFNGKNNYNNYYKQIRKRAIKYGEKEALIALAKFNKPEDIKAILKWKDRAFPAIAENPKPYFWKLLIDEFDNLNYGVLGSDEFDNREYFRAVSSYKNNDAEELLNNIYLKLKVLYSDYELELQIKTLHENLAEFKCKPFDDLMIRILEEYKIIDYYSYQYLKSNYPDNFQNVLEETLLNNCDFNFQSYFELEGENYNLYLQDSIYVDMIKVLQNKLKSEDFVEILNSVLTYCNFKEVEFFVPFAITNFNKNTQNIILERLKNERHGNVAYNWSEVLLSYNEDNFRIEIENLLDNGRDSWGNWANSITELLRDYK